MCIYKSLKMCVYIIFLSILLDDNTRLFEKLQLNASTLSWVNFGLSKKCGQNIALLKKSFALLNYIQIVMS